jgi:hypothetical protein
MKTSWQKIEGLDFWTKEVGICIAIIRCFTLYNMYLLIILKSEL